MVRLHSNPAINVALPPLQEGLETHPLIGDRTEILKTLLPYDYEYALDSGLIDLFDHNPQTGVDGLLHTLAGSIDTGAGGSKIASGFHHEESGRIWGQVLDDQGARRWLTRVDRDHLEQANSATRRQYRERLAEPYLAHVVVKGQAKVSISKDPETQKVTLEPVKSSMYPKEYDALAVMQAVRIAYENRNPTEDQISVDHAGNKVLVGQGTVPLIDGKTPMPIRLIINPNNMKVITAVPLTGGTKALMGLRETDLQHHITYGHMPKQPL